jgi:hypothetical protein
MMQALPGVAIQEGRSAEVVALASYRAISSFN